MGERTGSRIFQWVWSYVVVSREKETCEAQLAVMPTRSP
ncbi:hypothetical protein CLIM01_06744 [Colletotrichum limetticola]|uniref:Uncharacterized protein n=1 Tax=Colletotrichum limetticola TaxID=1209924 RepID=A0ABQ9PWI7_9PEZI|nr:hypothetical protein CLIM01_06744 [Colletotrichum limetticola]